MSKDKRYIPNLKFEEFNNNGKWIPNKFAKIVTRISTTSDNKTLPRIEYEDIISSRGTLNKDVYRKDSIKKGIEFQSQDILFGKLRPYLKNWLFPDFTGIAVGDFWVFRSSDTNPKFIYSLIQTERYQRISNLSTGTKMPRSDWNIVSNTNFIIPKSMKEQQKIGSFFEKIDKMIQLQQSKVNKVKDIKSAYLSEMFPKEGEKYPKKRFEGFTEPWKKVRLEQVLNQSGSGGTPRTTREEYYGGDIPFLGISDITISNGYIFNTEKTITIKGVNNSAAWIVPKESISLAMYASVGKVAILKIKSATSQAFYNMVINNQPTRDYVYQYLVKMEAENMWDRIISTGTQANLNAEKVRNLIISMPIDIVEREKIGQFFKKLDNQISIEEEKLTKLEKLKQAYLNDMFI